MLTLLKQTLRIWRSHFLIWYHLQKNLPLLQILPSTNPSPAFTSVVKREKLDFRIKFVRITFVSS
ncbi:MAG: hypothetical protein NW214_01700 [Pseudanabaenaceae cyanobacterium bins.39]|nr:hypothetical protein [Pseudanabaenaceae cyanobacterium bins.39]